jgi:RNA polymerase sigma-70 factor (ECF subfamily)
MAEMVGLAELDDETLIARSRDADAGAVRALVARHVDEAYRIAYRMVGNRAQAEDIAQDVLMRMLTYQQGWFSTASFHTWLRRAIINRAIDVYRKRRPSTPLDEAGEIPDGAGTQEEALITGEAEARVAAAVLALPERQRAAITLCFYENMALAEAAEVLKTSVGAVESLLHRAKAALRETLIEAGVRPAKPTLTKLRTFA